MIAAQLARATNTNGIHRLQRSKGACSSFSGAAAASDTMFSSSASSLPRPTIIYSNHHLLVTNKPAGWHSIPNPSSPSHKCLLTYLKKQRLGGGSANDFLRPVHRVDQPCTGILLFAKNGKAASRIQKAWAKGEVVKEYLCVVEASSMNEVRKRSISLEDFQRITSDENLLKKYEWGSAGWIDRDETYVLAGVMHKGQGIGSVSVTPIDLRVMEQQSNLSESIDNGSFGRGGRLCHLRYRHLASISDRRRGRSNKAHLLAARTATGARHQVRAILSAVGGCPIVGDLRYGATRPALPDRSVALHARSLYMPTVKLGGTDLITNPFAASIPFVWKDFFALFEDDVQSLEDS